MMFKLAQVTVDLEDAFKSNGIQKHRGAMLPEEAVCRVYAYGYFVSSIVTASILGCMK